jgi:DNA polymerase IV (DinB-like DNA polymerase)
LQGRVIVFTDLDYFFAQVEENRNPSLKYKPVVICVYSGRSEDSGAVSTANYIARKYGVKSGMPIAMAKRKLHDTAAVFLPVDTPFYEKISDEIMNTLRSFADNFEQVGIDEAYLDVSQKVNSDFDETSRLAQRIKEQIKAGHKLTCSIGIGPNKLVAKIAVDLQKPDGLMMIKPEEVERVLFPLAVDRLIGVGTKTSKKMQAMGIATIGDLARYDIQKLIEIFGQNLGSYFHNASLGVDDEPVQERGEAESVSRISTLKEDTQDLDYIVTRTDQLCDEIVKDVVQRDVLFQTIGIVAILTDLSVHSRSKTLKSPTNDAQVLKDTARELFGKFLKKSDLKARRVGVKVSNFVKVEGSQRRLLSFLE